MSCMQHRGATRALLIAIVLASPFCVRARDAAHAEPASERHGAPARDALLGEWWTRDNEGRVRFTRHSDGTFRGTTTCCVPDQPSPERPATDIHNPDPKLRGRSTVGIVIIWNLAYDDGEYSGGYVYNPRDGKTYRFAVQVIDRDSIEVRGYLGIPLLGQSQVWKRVRADAAPRAR